MAVAPSPDLAASDRLSPGFADEALETFSRSHVGILDKLERLRALPEMIRSQGAESSAVKLAAASIHRFFNEAVLPHHDEEEHELFPALRHSARSTEEAGLVQSITHRIEREHREMEQMWDELEPVLRRIGRGKKAELDAALVSRFTDAYRGHASFEEAAVLPLADHILKAGDRSALALALAMRRLPSRAFGYI